MKRTLFFICTLLCVNVLLAEVGVGSVFTVNGISYEVTTQIGVKEVEVTQATTGFTASGVLVIPEAVTYEGVIYSVTSIGKYAFDSKTEITSVIIPNSVTIIKQFAFSKCTNLTSVTIGSGIQTIEKYAFNRCTNLTSVTCYATNAPSIITGNTFASTPSNKTLIIPAGATGYESWPGFTNGGTVVVAQTFTVGYLTYEVIQGADVKVKSCNTSAIDVEIPTTVTYNGTTYNVILIGDLAFNGCNSLNSITCLSETGLPLVGNAFGLCASNKTLTVPFGSDYSYWETATTWSKVYHKIPENTTITLSNDFTVTDLRTILNQGVLRITQNGQLINTSSENVSGVYEIETPTLPTDKWSFVGAPFNGYKLEAIKEGTKDVSVSLFDYGTGTWSEEWATVEDTVGAGEGYFLWSFAAEPTIFTTDSETQDDHYTLNNDVVTVTKDLTTHQEGGNWMALANPYTFKLDIQKFLSAQTGVQGGVYYRLTYNASNQPVWETASIGELNLTEGFFVNFTNPGNNTATFNKDQRFIGSKKIAEERNFIHLTMTEGANKSELLFAQNEEAKQEYDIFDANKMFSPAEVSEPYFVTEGVALVKEEVQSLPYTATLNVKSYESKEITFRIDNIPTDINVYLLDNGQDIKMNGGVEYTTNITAGENADRFQILFKKQQKIERAKTNQITIKNYNRHITIQSQITNLNIEVYNSIGQKVLETKSYDFHLDQVPAGSYVVKAYYGRVNQSQKIVIE